MRPQREQIAGAIVFIVFAVMVAWDARATREIAMPTPPLLEAPLTDVDDWHPLEYGPAVHAEPMHDVNVDVNVYEPITPPLRHRTQFMIIPISSAPTMRVSLCGYTLDAPRTIGHCVYLDGARVCLNPWCVQNDE